MWPQISRPSIYNGTSSSFEHSSGTTYAKFLENRYKLYGDLDDHSRRGYNHFE